MKARTEEHLGCNRLTDAMGNATTLCDSPWIPVVVTESINFMNSSKFQEGTSDGGQVGIENRRFSFAPSVVPLLRIR